MSYTEIVGFDKKGDAYREADVKNAFRGAMAIWRILENRYLPPFVPKYAKKLGINAIEEFERRFNYRPTRCSTIMEDDAMREVWGLFDKKEVSRTDKICIGTTFDHCLVKKENIPEVIKAFREFDGATSLKEQADILEKMYEDENCIAVGWNQTSVSDNQWMYTGDYDKETDEPIPYNCLSGDVHFWLFDELESEAWEH